ncbi:hypothetical protein [Flavobacterium sp.]|uniref:hypothetical protein n=1 Tax=Flavobacterium sp. TaxID=239 RepID=UPI00286DD1FF|nr:hypothetical protein [Flavobacterium sp.]
MEIQNKKISFRSVKETSSLILAGKKAAQKAIRENTVLGLSFTFTKGNKVYRQEGNGAVIFVKPIAARKPLNIKKGTILYAKAK